MASGGKGTGFLIAVVMISLIGQGVASRAVRAQDDSESGPSQVVTGAACFVVTPVYGAFKLAFAGMGAIVGGLTWVFTGGDEAAAQKIWDASLKGTYIITPDHLRGRKPVKFVGP